MPQPAFAHGSSYVAFSRGITQDNPKILIKPNDSERDGHHNVSSFCILCSRDGLVDFRLENFNSERERDVCAGKSVASLYVLLGGFTRPSTEAGEGRRVLWKPCMINVLLMHMMILEHLVMGECTRLCSVVHCTGRAVRYISQARI